MFFKDAVSALGNTPLVELSRINPHKKVRLLAKLEGQNLGGSSSVKDRVACYMIQQAEQSGKLTKDKIILEATSGNTGISLAWLGYNRGYKVTIVMPESMSAERQKLIKIFHADLVLTPAKEGMSGAIRKAQEMAQGKRYFLTDQFGNAANPLTHYETTGPEILKDFPYEKIDILVAGIGTGGTIMGVRKRLREKFPDIRVVGVEPSEKDPIQGLKYVSGDYVPPVLDLKKINERIFVSCADAEAAARQLLKKEGIFAGQSSGAAVHQALQLAGEIREGNIVALLPDGGLKYLSLDFWFKNAKNT